MWRALRARPAGDARLLESARGETFICEHVGADRWTTASVGITQAVTPKKPIPISPRNGEVSEKAGSGSRGDRLSGPGKGGWQPVGPSGRINCARRARLETNGCIFATAGGPKN